MYYLKRCTGCGETILYDPQTRTYFQIEARPRYIATEHCPGCNRVLTMQRTANVALDPSRRAKHE